MSLKEINPNNIFIWIYSKSTKFSQLLISNTSRSGSDLYADWNKFIQNIIKFLKIKISKKNNWMIVPTTTNEFAVKA